MIPPSIPKGPEHSVNRRTRQVRGLGVTHRWQDRAVRGDGKRSLSGWDLQPLACFQIRGPLRGVIHRMFTRLLLPGILSKHFPRYRSLLNALPSFSLWIVSTKAQCSHQACLCSFTESSIQERWTCDHWETKLLLWWKGERCSGGGAGGGRKGKALSLRHCIMKNHKPTDQWGDYWNTDTVHFSRKRKKKHF